MKRGLRRVLAIGFLAFLGLALLGFARAEWGQGRILAASDIALRLAPAPLTRAKGQSLEAVYARLVRCLDLQAAAARGLYGAEARAPLALICARMADEVLADAPSLSLAHLLRAQAQAQMGQDPLPALRDARATGGVLVWMAAHRLRLLLDQPALEQDLIGDELVLLGPSPQGRAHLRAAYLAGDATRRGVLAAGFARLEAGDQAALLRVIGAAP